MRNMSRENMRIAAFENQPRPLSAQSLRSPSPCSTLNGSCSKPSMTIIVLTSWDPSTRVSRAKIDAVLHDLGLAYLDSIHMVHGSMGFHLRARWKERSTSMY